MTVEPVIYYGCDAFARIGPPGAWKVGDAVSIPRRLLSRAFDGVVKRVEDDGVAVVVARDRIWP